MDASRLPNEILAMFVKEAMFRANGRMDTATLGAVSLVCKDWLPHGRRHLFHEVDVAVVGVLAKQKLVHSPLETFKPHVKRLRVLRDYNPRERLDVFQEEGIKSVLHLIVALPYLEELHIQCRGTRGFRVSLESWDAEGRLACQKVASKIFRTRKSLIPEDLLSGHHSLKVFDFQCSGGPDFWSWVDEIQGEAHVRVLDLVGVDESDITSLGRLLPDLTLSLTQLSVTFQEVGFGKHVLRL